MTIRSDHAKPQDRFEELTVPAAKGRDRAIEVPTAHGGERLKDSNIGP
jgi:hypothetical protein